MTIDDVALVDALKRAWRHPRAGKQFEHQGWRPVKPMGPRHDRTGWKNPYWDIVRWLPCESRYYGDREPSEFLEEAFDPETSRALRSLGASRHTLVREYSWAIPTTYDIEWMRDRLNGRKVVESGAGSGYWAWQLGQAGVEVAAYDPKGTHEMNRYAKNRFWHVHQGDASCVLGMGHRALFLSWPRHDEPDAYEALSQYEGDMFFYAGEWQGGCTGDNAFFKMLSDEWEFVDSSPLHTTFSGIHCQLEMYVRK